MEDVETSYYPDYGGGAPGQAGTTISLLKQLADVVNFDYHGQVADCFDSTLEHNDWTVLSPQSVSTSSGTPLRVLPDQSLIRSQPFSARDTYVIKAFLPLERVSAIRLEVLPDAALPGTGPGCAPNGNFVLTSFDLRWHADGMAKCIILDRVSGTFSQSGFEASSLATSNSGNGWGIAPRLGRSSEAVISLAPPLINQPEGILTIVLSQLYGDQHIVGRFRLSVTDVMPPCHCIPAPTVDAIHFHKNVCFIRRTALSKGQ